MKVNAEALIVESAYHANILPLTSVCNVKCVFCSHPQNPKGVRAVRIGHRTLEQVQETLTFIDPHQKIVIGESVTLIMEGEPFCHPQILDILRYIRSKFPSTLIQITTNGNRLTEETVKFLASLGKCEINLSLNSANPKVRAKMMNDKAALKAMEAAFYLNRYDVPYHGSIVAMPFLTGWEDLQETVTFLDANNALTVRVFLPGYSDIAMDNLKFDQNLHQNLVDFVCELNRKVFVPVLLEPPLINDLSCRVKGVLRGSPAFASGIQKADIITKVNGKPCSSRVDAFERIVKAKQPSIEIKRDNETICLHIDKKAEESSGLVMEYDISSDSLQEIHQVAGKYKNPMLLCSKLGQNVLEMALASSPLESKIRLVENHFFGGSIGCAGLLTVSDFIHTVIGLLDEGENPDSLLVPAVAFDRRGFDVTGESYMKIEECTGINVEII